MYGLPSGRLGRNVRGDASLEQRRKKGLGKVPLIRPDGLDALAMPPMELIDQTLAPVRL